MRRLISVTCFSHLMDVFYALSGHADLDPTGLIIRHQEVDDVFIILDDADWWAHVQPVLRPLVPWLSLDPVPDKMLIDKEEWYRQAVDMTDPEAFPFQQPDGPSVIFYHGTNADVCFRILKCGAFIPGPNGHTKGKSHFKGCFGSREFSVASFRGDQTRGLSSEVDGSYSFSCCPLVLELEASCAHLKNYKRVSSLNSSLGVSTGIPSCPNEFCPTSPRCLPALTPQKCFAGRSAGSRARRAAPQAADAAAVPPVAAPEAEPAARIAANGRKNSEEARRHPARAANERGGGRPDRDRRHRCGNGQWHHCRRQEELGADATKITALECMHAYLTECHTDYRSVTGSLFGYS